MMDSYFWRMSPLKRLIFLKRYAGKGGGGGGGITKTVTGTLLHILDALAKPAVSFEVGIEPQQDLHGQDAPYPSGGGKNKTDYVTDYVPTVGVNNGAQKQFEITLKAGTYTFSCKQSASIPASTRNTLAVVVGDGSYQYESTAENYNPVNLRHEKTFTVTEETKCSFYIWQHTPSVAATFNEWQVEESSSFTGYAPYSNECPITGWTGVDVYRSGADTSNPTTIPITFPDAAGTVYGCTLTNNGTDEWKLRVTYAEVDMGTLTYTYDGVSQGFYTNILDKSKTNPNPNVLCSTYKTHSVNGENIQIISQMDDKSIAGFYSPSSSNSWLYIKDSSYSTAASLKASLSGVQLVYELATPVTYTLTGQQALTLLKGENNIWSSVTNGELSLTYKASAS